LLATVGATALLLLPLPVAPLVRRWPALLIELEDLGHPLLFALLAVLCFRWVRAHRPSPARAPYIVALAGAVLFGLATEAAQQGLGRDASWRDLLNDVLGAILALLLCAHREAAPSEHRARRRSRALAAVLLAAAMLSPFLWTCAAYLHRAWQVPVLWQPDSALFARFSRWQGGTYPGLVIDEPAADWSRYAMLVLELRNRRARTSVVVVRAHDRTHTQRHADRFNAAFELPPDAVRTIRIPLEQLRRAPDGRQMDLGAMKGLAVFQTAARQPPFFQVREIRLE
jgi:VanZ family protein